MGLLLEPLGRNVFLFLETCSPSLVNTERLVGILRLGGGAGVVRRPGTQGWGGQAGGWRTRGGCWAELRPQVNSAPRLPPP